MRKIFTLLLILAATFVYSQEFIKLNQVLSTADGNINIYVHYVNKEYQISDSFYASFETDINNDKLVYLENGIIYNKNGIELLNLSKRNPPFYGYKLSLSYPKNRKFSPGLNLDPYFGSKDSVGDTQSIDWDSTNKTFKKRVSLVP